MRYLVACSIFLTDATGCAPVYIDLVVYILVIVGLIGLYLLMKKLIRHIRQYRQYRG